MQKVGNNPRPSSSRRTMVRQQPFLSPVAFVHLAGFPHPQFHQAENPCFGCMGTSCTDIGCPTPDGIPRAGGSGKLGRCAERGDDDYGRRSRQGLSTTLPPPPLPPFPPHLIPAALPQSAPRCPCMAESLSSSAQMHVKAARPGPPPAAPACSRKCPLCLWSGGLTCRLLPEGVCWGGLHRPGAGRRHGNTHKCPPSPAPGYLLCCPR